MYVPLQLKSRGMPPSCLSQQLTIVSTKYLDYTTIILHCYIVFSQTGIAAIAQTEKLTSISTGETGMR